MKLKGNHLWRLQKGNPVEWHNGHLKGTGTVVKPFFERTVETIDGRQIKSFEPDGFEVRDDATGEVNRFYLKDINTVKKK